MNHIIHNTSDWHECCHNNRRRMLATLAKISPSNGKLKNYVLKRNITARWIAIVYIFKGIYYLHGFRYISFFVDSLFFYRGITAKVLTHFPTLNNTFRKLKVSEATSKAICIQKMFMAQSHVFARKYEIVYKELTLIFWSKHWPTWMTTTF